MPTNVTIPMHLIDEPEVAMRTEIGDDYLRELADDIQAQGLINPISVKKEGDRYRIGAGHRRYLAHKLLGREVIEARDYTDDATPLEAIKFAENMLRVDVTDAEMAIWLAEIQDKHHYDIDTLMRLTRRTENWINTRLQLFAGDKGVFAALSNGLIKLGHAVTLNRFPAEFRAQYLEACINSTPPVRVVENWLIDLKKMGIEGLPQPVAPDGAAPAVLLPGVIAEACWFCGSNALSWTMEFPRIHQHCREMIQKQVAEAGG